MNPYFCLNSFLPVQVIHQLVVAAPHADRQVTPRLHRRHHLVQVRGSFHVWQQLVTSGHKWLQLVTTGHSWQHMVKREALWLVAIFPTELTELFKINRMDRRLHREAKKVWQSWKTEIYPFLSKNYTGKERTFFMFFFFIFSTCFYPFCTPWILVQ